ncbi:MAG: phage portal protein [Burkholderiaceae bacterium]|nr:phage portal protein [Burkholderiaceae bacterium]
MADGVDESENSGKPTAQVYRLVSAGSGKEPVQKFLRRQGIDAPENVVRGNAFEPEDEYQDLYLGAQRDQGILEPPYSLRTLDRLSQENNALSPCIEAMVTNIDGTGYDFTSEDEEVEDAADDKNIEQLRDFFDEPWPGESFVTIRQKLRRDLERTGNAYLEVLRNAQDEVVFIRPVDAKMMRLVKLDDAIPVEKIIRRRGKEVKITVMERQRRYCQLVNGVSLVYFKDFGVERDLHKTTAVWAPKGMRLPAKDRATEIIHFRCLPDAHTPYGVPRWISQLPSVLGSRKAEEFNMEFFDNGGVPPVLILLQGGMLQTETRKALEEKVGLGTAASKNRVQILEVEPTGGSMDNPTQARVTVERFGGERTNDSMFEKYDDKCEQRVRRAFRLPPIFVGKADDYSFATAYVSYNVAEAQIFKPERDEFDEVITMKLLAAMGYREYKLASKPLTIEDTQLKLQGIELAISTNRVEMEDILYEINEACGTNIKVSEEVPEATMTVDLNGNVVPLAQGNKGGQAPGDTESTPTEPTTPSKAQKIHKGATQGVLALAQDTLIALRERNFTDLSRNVQLIATLDDHGRKEFQKACATLQFVDPSHDHEGLGELMGCTIAVMQGDYHHGHHHAH